MRCEVLFKHKCFSMWNLTSLLSRLPWSQRERRSVVLCREFRADGVLYSRWGGWCRHTEPPPPLICLCLWALLCVLLTTCMACLLHVVSAAAFGLTSSMPNMFELKTRLHHEASTTPDNLITGITKLILTLGLSKQLWARSCERGVPNMI